MTRKEAKSIMNVIVHMLEPQYDTDRIEDAVDMLIKALEQEPKTGHWIDMTSGYAFNDKCSECGYIVHIQFINEYKYCPNCGVKMESEYKE